MNDKNTGDQEFPFNERQESAFPSTYNSLDGNAHIHKFGMTLRDYFAAKAMVGLMSTERANEYVDEDGVFSDEDGTLFVHTKFLAEEAYMIADAMLATRSQA